MLRTTVPRADLPFCTVPFEIEPVTVWALTDAAVNSKVPSTNPKNLIFITELSDEVSPGLDVLFYPDAVQSYFQFIRKFLPVLR